MRSLIACSVGAACAAALVVPLALPANAAAGSAAGLQSLPLRPLESGLLSDGTPTPTAEGTAPAGVLGLPATDTEPFSLLGVIWEDAGTELAGEAQVRTRAAGTGTWSPWTGLDYHSSHAPDSRAAEAAEDGGPPLHGGTAPMWVGPSDGVQVRVVPAEGTEPGSLPEGLRVELIDTETGPGATGETIAGEVAGVPPAGGGTADDSGGGAAPSESEENGGDPGEEEGLDEGTVRDTGEEIRAATTGDHQGPRPPIVTRSGWGADEGLRESGFVYTDRVTTAFVHHTAGTNSYSCSQSASLIRGIYRYHVQSQGWRDVGYNFFVDKCGTIYEGRAGGVAEPVQGAHTYGFNHNSMGVAVLGTYSATEPGHEVRDALALLTAWKLGLHNGNPLGSSNRTSGGGKYPAGTTVRMNNISGHRDGFATECPGDRLYAELPSVRSVAGRLQGR